MKRIVLTLATLAAMALTANLAFAQGALSYPMAAHVAARYGVVHPGHNPLVYQAHRHHHWRHGGPIVVRPPLWAYPPVVVPYPVYPPVYPPYRYYW